MDSELVNHFTLDFLSFALMVALLSSYLWSKKILKGHLSEREIHTAEKSIFILPNDFIREAMHMLHTMVVCSLSKNVASW